MDLDLETVAVTALRKEIVAVVQPLAERRDTRLVLAFAADMGVLPPDLTKRGREAAPICLDFDAADAGIGMAVEQVRRVFMESSRANAAMPRCCRGSGARACAPAPGVASNGAVPREPRRE